MLHCAAITGLLCCRESPNLVRMFVWVRSWSSSNMGHLGFVCPSVCPHFLCAMITGILFYREFSNSFRMFLWTRSWSTSNIAHLGSVRLSTLSFCCDNWNTFLERTFKLCIWVIHQIRRTPVAGHYLARSVF